MEIFGVGTAELLAILLIALVVAGPKRMIQWAYVLGKYVARARALWAETMTYLQKELDTAGVDVQLPKEPPTRGSLNRQIGSQLDRALSPVTRPVQDALTETQAELGALKKQATISEPAIGKPQPPGPILPTASSNGDGIDLGTWSGSKPDAGDAADS